MSETGMIPDSGTQVDFAGDATVVKVQSGLHMRASTQTEGSGVHGIVVRLTEGQGTVVLRVDPKVLDEQQKIEEMNRNIRRHGRAY